MLGALVARLSDGVEAPALTKAKAILEPTGSS